MQQGSSVEDGRGSGSVPSAIEAFDRLDGYAKSSCEPVLMRAAILSAAMAEQSDLCERLVRTGPPSGVAPFGSEALGIAPAAAIDSGKVEILGSVINRFDRPEPRREVILGAFSLAWVKLLSPLCFEPRQDAAACSALGAGCASMASLLLGPKPGSAENSVASSRCNLRPRAVLSGALDCVEFVVSRLPGWLLGCAASLSAGASLGTRAFRPTRLAKGRRGPQTLREACFLASSSCRNEQVRKDGESVALALLEVLPESASLDVLIELASIESGRPEPALRLCALLPRVASSSRHRRQQLAEALRLALRLDSPDLCSALIGLGADPSHRAWGFWGASGSSAIFLARELADAPYAKPGSQRCLAVLLGPWEHSQISDCIAVKAPVASTSRRL